LSYNRKITDEGAKILSKSQTLLQVDLEGTNASKDGQHKVLKRLQKNQKTVDARLNSLLRNLLILARDQANLRSESLWKKLLTKEIRIYIMSFLYGTGIDYVGKSSEQLYYASKFLFLHIYEWSDAINHHKHYRLIERISLPIESPERFTWEFSQSGHFKNIVRAFSKIL
jgi:hypothetical protein